MELVKDNSLEMVGVLMHQGGYGHILTFILNRSKKVIAGMIFFVQFWEWVVQINLISSQRNQSIDRIQNDKTGEKHLVSKHEKCFKVKELVLLVLYYV